MKSIKTKDYSVSQEDFTLIYNSEYDLYQTTPIPENLSEYYESEDYISHTDAKETFIDKLYQQVKKYSLKKKEKLVSGLIQAANKSLLDIGCGTGSFLEEVNKNGWHSIGIEPSEKARDLAREKNVISVPTSQEIQNHTFDAITLWHVLEHVEDLDKQFNEFNRLLNENGVVVIAVPNYKSYDASFYKKYWAAFDVPRHLWHFSETAISKLAQLHKFELLESKPMWFDSFYVALLSEKYKYKRVNYLRAFYVGLLSNLKALKNGEFSSKIYILKQKN